MFWLNSKTKFQCKLRLKKKTVFHFILFPQWTYCFEFFRPLVFHSRLRLHHLFPFNNLLTGAEFEWRNFTTWKPSEIRNILIGTEDSHANCFPFHLFNRFVLLHGNIKSTWVTVSVVELNRNRSCYIWGYWGLPLWVSTCWFLTK